MLVDHGNVVRGLLHGQLLPLHLEAEFEALPEGCSCHSVQDRIQGAVYGQYEDNHPQYNGT